MYPISINLRAESDLRAPMGAHACLSLNETLCDGGAVSGAASTHLSVRVSWLHTHLYRFVTYE